MKKQMLQHLQDYLLGLDKGFAFEERVRDMRFCKKQSDYTGKIK